MGKYLLRRLANYVVLLFIAVSFAYFLAASQLRPREKYEHRNPPLNPVALDNMLSANNLNDKTPLLERYWHWLTAIVTRWDWGKSPDGAPVNDEIGRRVWVSFRLVTIGWLLGNLVGVTVGAWTATKQYQWSDRVITAITLFFLAIPSYVMITVLQMITTNINQSVGGNFQFMGETTTGPLPDYPLAGLVDRLQHLLLPTIVLTVLGSASLSRIQRNLMLDSLGADHVRTARAKGLRQGKAVMKHALRTALIPTGTYFAFGAASIFVGATFTERLFGFHGMGEYGVNTINLNDVHGVVAVTAFGGVCYLVGAMLADVFVAILDPRVRLS